MVAQQCVHNGLCMISLCIVFLPAIWAAAARDNANDELPKGLKEGTNCKSRAQCDPVYILGLDCVKGKCKCIDNVDWDDDEGQCVWQSYKDECTPDSNGKNIAGNCAYGLKCAKGKGDKETKKYLCECAHENTDMCDGRVMQGLIHHRSAAHQRHSSSRCPGSSLTVVVSLVLLMFLLRGLLEEELQLAVLTFLF